MTTHSLTGTSDAAVFDFRPQRRSVGLILSLTAHGALAAFLLWLTRVPAPEHPPPAVIVMLSASIENNETTKPLPVGIQQVVDSATSSKQEMKPQLQRNTTLPVDESAEIKLVQQREKPKEQQKRRKRVQTQERQQYPTRASAASAAAPPVTAAVSNKIAAPMNSDSSQTRDAEATWETRVKEQLNRLKKYPRDAIYRHRTGVALVTFIVDERGDVTSSRLLKSSGTMSMDAEALAVLKRASPLPQPPGEMLKSGQIQVTMPLEFTLSGTKSRKY